MEEWEGIGKELRRNKAIEQLTRRELQVFILSGRSKTLGEISVILNISNRTVSTHRLRIMQKMELENVYEVIAYCIRADMDGDRFMNKWLDNLT